MSKPIKNDFIEKLGVCSHGHISYQALENLCNLHATTVRDQRARIKILEAEMIEVKELLKESIEKFPTKERAERVYKIPGIKLPPPKPMPVEKDDEEIPY